MAVDIQTNKPRVIEVASNRAAVVEVSTTAIAVTDDITEAFNERLVELEQASEETDEALDGKVNGMDFLTHYRLIRDN